MAPDTRHPRDRRKWSVGVALVAMALAAMLGAGLLAACGEEAGPAPSSSSPSSVSAARYTDISPQELSAMLNDKDFVLVNTHVPYEGEIEQTDLFIPYDQAAAQLDRLPADKDAKIVVYCRSDRMSRIAAEAWAAAGYTNLYNLDGGFVAWEEAGFELLQKPQ